MSGKGIVFRQHPFVSVTDYGDGLDDRGISDLEISARLFNALNAEGLVTLRQVLARSRNQIRLLPNVGLITVNELVTVLRARGLFLLDDDGTVESSKIELRKAYGREWRLNHWCDRCGRPHAYECNR